LIGARFGDTSHSPFSSIESVGPDFRRTIPLMMAAIKGHTEAIKALISEGAKVSAVSKPVEWDGRLNEFSPLCLAILGNKEVLRILDKAEKAMK